MSHTMKIISLFAGVPLALALLAGAGCGKRLAIVKKDEPPAAAAAPSDQGKAEEGGSALPGGGAAGDTVIVKDLPPVVESDLAAGGGTPAAGAPSEEVRDVFFGFDQATIGDVAAETLKEDAGWISAHPKAAVRIEGTADERGTDEYNLALGEKRAQAVKRYLEALGISGERMETVSFGEEKSYCSESTEECWAQNRRGHFVLMGEPAVGKGG